MNAFKKVFIVCLILIPILIFLLMNLLSTDNQINDIRINFVSILVIILSVCIIYEIIYIILYVVLKVGKNVNNFSLFKDDD